MSVTIEAKQKWLMSALLAASVFAVYWPVLHGGFVNYDDFQYVVDNWYVHHGFNWQGVRWAFTTDAASNWHPVTWLSHIVDFHLYGPNPLGHHLTSLILHAANAVLLFLVLRRMTGALWRSALVASLFAFHPLRVESVAWVAERKDVLSGFFCLLTLLAYARFAEETKVQNSNSKFFYSLALLFFAIGLMAKPMLVTLPFILLLVDYWPLRRWEVGKNFSWGPVIEKIPFLVLAAASSLVTVVAQRNAGAVVSLARVPLDLRVAHVPVAYAQYLGLSFWPAKLESFYPYTIPSAALTIGTAALLGGLTALALWRAESEPGVTVGWLWFLGMLVPVIGLVQAGGQSLADRYTYLASIGLWIAVVWGVNALVCRSFALRAAAITAVAASLVLFAIHARQHTRDYENSGTLWEATLRSEPNSRIAHNLLAKWFIENARWDQAIEQCRDALANVPEDPIAHDNLAQIYLKQGKTDDAVTEALKSIAAQPRSPANRETLAKAYLQQGHYTEAEASLREAVRLDPSASEAWCNLGFALLQQGQVAEATDAYQKSLVLNPDFALAHNDLGNIFLRQGRADDAMSQFQQAVELDPKFAEAHYNLAGLLAHRGQLDDAIAHCQKALEIQPNLTAARQRLESLVSAKQRNGGH